MNKKQYGGGRRNDIPGDGGARGQVRGKYSTTCIGIIIMIIYFNKYG